ncbi:cadherin-like beta sandwich domain-containing protein [Paenibacillus protaetiae]|uniref:SLH domain-containing protein n=1 Tax=Paenibacillus protaetiae TaxID=2509456 RepID=A0A4P6EQW9_9BACL|nr:cadherin-like beta sandwich domain-containing protein [Paenibacillus protaetiae]QAY65242.1 hypothetical protein ET464_01440 [Paenibacillus protaetiae]
MIKRVHSLVFVMLALSVILYGFGNPVMVNAAAAPTDLVLSNTSINRSAADHSIVGTLATMDEDAGDTFTYSLVAGTGSDNNSLFELAGNRLQAVSPAAMSPGTYSVRIRTTDSTGGSFENVFAITVIGSSPPIAFNDSYNTSEDMPLSVSVPGVLANDSDADGDALTATLVTGPLHGTLTLNSNGSLTYVPLTNYTGSDSFTYKACDGTVCSNSATATIYVAPGSAQSDVSIAALMVGGELAPAFSNDISDYDVYMDNSSNGSSYIAVMVKDARTKIDYRVNSGTWNSLGNWVSSGNIGMNPGLNLIEVKITSIDNSNSRMINLHVHRPLPNDSTIRKLEVSEGAFSPSFDPAITGYTVNVPYTTTSITITANLTDGDAAVTVDGIYPSSDHRTEISNLNVGSNNITITVTSADHSSVTTYTVNIVRAPASTNADLSDLGLSNGSLNPLFASGITAYTAEVDSDISSITVTPTAAEAHATMKVKVNGGAEAAVVSGTPTVLPLNVGDNTLQVQVTAQDGTTVKTYSISVHRFSSNADLSSLTLSSGMMSPGFNSATTEYDVELPNATSSFTFKPTLANPLSAVEWKAGSGTYASLTNNTDSPGIVLQEGLNTVLIKVTAEDGSEKVYTIRVNRESSNVKLSGLTLSSGSISPAFDENTFDYSTSVSYAIDVITLRALVADSHATAEIALNHGAYTSLTSGADSPQLSLNQGKNTIQIKVTAQSGAEQIYTITVHRGNAPTSSVPPVVDPPAPTVSFNDITGHWAEEMILEGAEQGWISGYPDGSFHPNAAVTRQDFVVIIAQALGWQRNAALGNHSFSDQAEIAPYAADAVQIAFQKGLVNGYGNGSFLPDAPINRAEVVVMLMRSLGQQPASAASTGFDDDSHIPLWAKPSVAAANEAGLINGRGNNTFVPDAAATRAEAVTMMLHLLDYNKRR